MEWKADGISKILEPTIELNESRSTLTDGDSSEDIKGAVLPVTILIAIEVFQGIAGTIFILIIYSLRYRRCNFEYFVLYMTLIDLTSSLTTFRQRFILSSASLL